jgi:metal-responsive CopG/Arc/MetJ family transcriptional regulator
MGRKLGINRSKVGFSLNKETYLEFEKYCEENSINRSKLVDKILKSFLEKENIKNAEKILNNHVG